MGAKGQPKTGGKVKGSKNKRTLLEAEIGKLLPEDKTLTKAIAWLKELWVKDRTAEETRIMMELMRMTLPFTDRKQPQALEADVKTDMTVILQPSDDDL